MQTNNLRRRNEWTNRRFYVAGVWNQASAIMLVPSCFMIGRQSHDPQIAVRRILTLLPQRRPQDGQAPQSRYVQIALGRRIERARFAIFQAALVRRSKPSKRGARFATSFGR